MKIKKRRCNGCDVTEYNENEYFKCAKCGFIHNPNQYEENDFERLVRQKVNRIMIKQKLKRIKNENKKSTI